jgi:hypothetical protein
MFKVLFIHSSIYLFMHFALDNGCTKIYNSSTTSNPRGIEFERKFLYKPGPTLNLLKPTDHVTHQQFNIQQLYALSTLYLCVLYLSENKQQLVPLTT